MWNINRLLIHFYHFLREGKNSNFVSNFLISWLTNLIFPLLLLIPLHHNQLFFLLLLSLGNTECAMQSTAYNGQPVSCFSSLSTIIVAIVTFPLAVTKCPDTVKLRAKEFKIHACWLDLMFIKCKPWVMSGSHLRGDRIIQD